MKYNFRETIQQKTDKELDVIARDCAFYSDEERLIALNELKKRTGLSGELTDIKMCIENSPGTGQAAYTEKPTQRIYRAGAIWVGTFLGGPLTAGYLIAENFTAFKEIKKSKKAWIYAIMTTVLIFGALFIILNIPDIKENAKIPYHFIILLYTFIAYFFAKDVQGRNIFGHIAAGGELYSWGRTIIVGLIGWVITFISILCLVILYRIATTGTIWEHSA